MNWSKAIFASFKVPDFRARKSTYYNISIGKCSCVLFILFK